MALSAEQRHHLRQKLIEEKEALLRQMEQNENHGLNLSARDQTGELSAYDNHPADLGSEMFERSKDTALQEHGELSLEAIDAALENMEKGNYGICAVCQQEIPYERLQAVPWTHYCVQHAPQTAVSAHRPAEERFLRPPYGRKGKHRPDRVNAFDGEDSWQIVQQWGTSESSTMGDDPVLDYNDLYDESEEGDGYTEPIDNFLATDLYGKVVQVIHGKTYREYMNRHEGEPLLEYISLDELKE